MPKIALIEYFSTTEKIYIFVVCQEDNEPVVIEAGIPNKHLKRCRDMLFGNKKEGLIGCFQVINPEKSFRTDLTFFYDLGKELIHKCLEYVKGYDTLCLVPHGWLHHLPIHALKCEDGQYLIEKFKIVYSPSATVIKYCQGKNKAREKDKMRVTERSCLALGTGMADDPESLKESFREEARYVGNEIFGQKGICKIDEKASKSYFITNCKNKDVLHIACHGFFDQINPLKSGLLLSDGKRLPELNIAKNQSQVIQDKILLSAEEVFNMDMSSELVVLSACVTGVNENRPGDELMGLTRALLYAGTPSVIVSLWNVYTDSTLQLMKSFYKYWMGSENAVSKVEALQKAQLDMLRNSVNDSWRHPYHWAPFVLVGDWI